MLRTTYLSFAVILFTTAHTFAQNRFGLIVHAQLDYAEDVTEEEKSIYSNNFQFNNLSITLGYTFNRR